MATIAVTGATGYIGGRLVPLLLEEGHRVRCLVREPERLAARPWRDRVEVRRADVLASEGLEESLEGCDAAFYLVHSMGASEQGFEDRDRAGARHFGAASRRAGVGHIVYLGGLGAEGEGLSRHLASRQETGRELARAGVPVTEFRAAVIVGSGSLSFEMIRYLTERLPVMVTPRWVETRVQPIAVRDVLQYLSAAVTRPARGHAVVEIGGPDVLTYRELMLGYAAVRGLRRVLLPVPVLSPRLSSYWVNLVTPIPASIARPLIEGLGSEVVVHDPEPARAFGVVPMPYRKAVELALDRTRQGAVATLWSDSVSAVPRGTPSADRLSDTEGMLIDRRSRTVAASAACAYEVLVRQGGDRGWYAYDGLWRLRGWLDRLQGGVGMRRGRRDPDTLLPGDPLDFWRVESVEPARYLQLRAEMKLPGRAWLRYDVEALPGIGCRVTQTATFEPHGLAGFLYWWALYPFHRLMFPALLQAVAQRAEQTMAAAAPDRANEPATDAPTKEPARPARRT
ncbi:MAG: SDR family oxidoreductase [Deinococcales bacterium]